MIDRSNQRWPRPQTDGLQIPPQNNQKLPRPEWGTLGQMGGQPESGRMPEVRPYDPGRGSPWTMDGLRPTNLPSGTRTMTGGGGTFLPGEMDPFGGSPLVGPDTSRVPAPTATGTSVWQNPAAANQSATSANAPRVVSDGQGGWVLTEHGNRRPLQPTEVAAAQKYVGDFWTANPTGFQATNANSVADAYRQFLGRQASSEELASHTGNPRGLAGIIQTIADSPEAKAYAAGQQNGGNTGNTGNAGNASLPPGAKTDQWSGPGAVTQRGNFGNLEGFDANNFGDDNMQTAKYQAGRILSRFDPNNPQVLASILADPEFQRMFPGAKGVGPDKIDFGDGRPVDVIRGHGAPGAKFSWQTMDGSGGAAARPATARYAPMMPSEAPMDIWTNAAMAPTMTPEVAPADDYALRTNRSAVQSARRS